MDAIDIRDPASIITYVFHDVSSTQYVVISSEERERERSHKSHIPNILEMWLGQSPMKPISLSQASLTASS